MFLSLFFNVFLSFLCCAILDGRCFLANDNSLDAWMPARALCYQHWLTVLTLSVCSVRSIDGLIMVFFAYERGFWVR